MMAVFWLLIMLSLVVAYAAGLARRAGFTVAMWFLLGVCALAWGVAAAVLVGEITDFNGGR